jgi:hypothetical protein
MPFHFCQDELFAILAMLPFLGAAVRWLKHKAYGSHHAHHEPSCGSHSHGSEPPTGNP